MFLAVKDSILDKVNKKNRGGMAAWFMLHYVTTPRLHSSSFLWFIFGILEGTPSYGYVLSWSKLQRLTGSLNLSHASALDLKPYWALLVRGFNLSYHNKETISFTKDPYYVNLNRIP